VRFPGKLQLWKDVSFNSVVRGCLVFPFCLVCCTYVVLFFSLHSSKAAAAAASRLFSTSKRFLCLSNLCRRLDDGRAGLHGESKGFANLACCFQEHTRRLATRPVESSSARLEKEGLLLLLRNPCSNQLVNAACRWSPLLTCSSICGSNFHGGSKFFTKSPCHGILAFLLFRHIKVSLKSGLLRKRSVLCVLPTTLPFHCCSIGWKRRHCYISLCQNSLFFGEV
jgi:hypothetical protein